MTKLDIFTNHFYPENFRINEISTMLSSQHNIKVITQVPNYPQGSFVKGYGWFKNHNQYCDNIKIKRLPVIPRGKSSFTLMLNYGSYILSSFFYSFYTKSNPDFVFVYITSPIFISWAGLRVAKKNHAPSTLYLLDLWPDVLFSMLSVRNKTIRKLFEKITINIYKRFDNIIVSSFSFIEVLVSYGIDRDKITYIPQHAEEVEIRKMRPQNQCLNVVFTGNIGEAQGLDVLVDTSQILKENNVENVTFTIVGDGRYKEVLQENIKIKGVENYFNFLGRVKPEQIPQFLNEADVGFVSLSNDETLNKTLPAKVQTYMAYGVPLLACASGEVPRVINKAKAGLSVPSNDSNSLYEAILRIKAMSYDEIEQFSINGYKYAKNNFNKDIIVSKINRIIKNEEKGDRY